jgi:adenine-specific DNA-methyltransferase
MSFFQIHNRRYTGSKQKLSSWIVNSINKEIKVKSFFDVFAGTGCISSKFINIEELIINDFLFSNNVIYKAFFDSKKYNFRKLLDIQSEFNNLKSKNIEDNYFNNNFGNKYFSNSDSKKIGQIRENLNSININKYEKNILLASLLYSVDKISNTVGHYDAYIKNKRISDRFLFNLIKPMNTKCKIKIYRNDANMIAEKINSDVAYIDPPYNSRQYSRFYHLLENLTQWKKPILYGTALKPDPENISDYSKTSAPAALEDLINKLKCKVIVLSYNNTYRSKSSSSKNKITLDQIEDIMKKKGKTKILKKKHAHFNAGKTYFDEHFEYLFITKL